MAAANRLPPFCSTQLHFNFLFILEFSPCSFSCLSVSSSPSFYPFIHHLSSGCLQTMSGCPFQLHLRNIEHSSDVPWMSTNLSTIDEIVQLFQTSRLISCYSKISLFVPVLDVAYCLIRHLTKISPKESVK